MAGAGKASGGDTYRVRSHLAHGILEVDGNRWQGLATDQPIGTSATARGEPAALSDRNEIDIALIESICGGDGEALRRLFDFYGQSVYSLVLGIVHDLAAADDVVIEVLDCVWQGAETFDPGRGTVRVWLLAIARYQALNEIRKRNSRPVLARAEAFQLAQLTLADLDPLGDPDAALLLYERIMVVRRALAHLSEQQWQVIYLVFYQGLSHSEIAAVLGVTLGVVKGHIQTAMRRLRNLLLDNGKDLLYD
jgi:RNA polymerase sigma-70 factor (ECF subfamily)